MFRRLSPLQANESDSSSSNSVYYMDEESDDSFKTAGSGESEIWTEASQELPTRKRQRSWSFDSDESGGPPPRKRRRVESTEEDSDAENSGDNFLAESLTMSSDDEEMPEEPQVDPVLAKNYDCNIGPNSFMHFDPKYVVASWGYKPGPDVPNYCIPAPLRRLGFTFLPPVLAAVGLPRRKRSCVRRSAQKQCRK